MPRNANATNDVVRSARHALFAVPYYFNTVAAPKSPCSTGYTFPLVVRPSAANGPCYAGGQCRGPSARASSSSRRRTSVARNVTVWWARPVGNPACYGMPIRRGHVTQRTTVIETIIRKFDTHSEYRQTNDNDRRPCYASKSASKFVAADGNAFVYWISPAPFLRLFAISSVCTVPNRISRERIARERDPSISTRPGEVGSVAGIFFSPRRRSNARETSETDVENRLISERGKQ